MSSQTITKTLCNFGGNLRLVSLNQTGGKLAENSDHDCWVVIEWPDRFPYILTVEFLRCVLVLPYRLYLFIYINILIYLSNFINELCNFI